MRLRWIIAAVILGASVQLACATPNRYQPKLDAGAEEDEAGAAGGNGASDGSGSPATDSASSLMDVPLASDGAPPLDAATTSDACGALDDPRNCGSCGHDCSRLPHVSAGAAVTCVAGRCAVPPGACLAGYAHCTSNADDGCETALSLPGSCGSCTNRCTSDALCGMTGGSYQCITTCSGATPDKCGGSCTNVNTDPRNCGACGRDCEALPNVRKGAPVTCQSGQCVIPASSCVSGYGHCTNSPADGCETDFSRSQTCGACGTSCPTGKTCAPVGGSFQCVCSGDCTAPTIIANGITPADGVSGVTTDARISIAFSEPMHRQATETAFASADIPARTFSWDSSGTILTVTPTGGLAYATGTDPSLAARSYSFSITTTATDLAGNHLQAASAVTFSTLRRITTQVGVVPQMSGNVAFTGETIVDDRWAAAGCDMAEENRAFITFNLASLPAAITTVESAELALVDNTTAPPFTPGVSVSVGHIFFSTTGPSLYNTQSELLGNLSRSGNTSRLSNDSLRDAVRADYMNRANLGNRSQYRMRVEVQCPSTPANARADYDPELSRLSITYLRK